MTKKPKPQMKPIRAWADCGIRSGKIATIIGDTAFYAIYPSYRTDYRDMKVQSEFNGIKMGNIVEVEIRPVRRKRIS